MRKNIKIIIIILISVYVVLGLYLYMFQKSFIYYPDKQDFNKCVGFEDSEKLNLNGTRAYYKKNSDKLVIFYHGNAGSTCNRSYLKKEFEKINLSYLFVEYAGYSNDTVKPSKNLLLKDVVNVTEFLSDKNYSEVIVMGESLGTALATYHSTLQRVDKLLLISPFYQMADIAKNSFGIYPIKLILRENYESNEWIKKSMTNNIRIIHGSNDEIIPIEQAKKLYEEINIKNKEFIEVNGAGHNDIYNFSETNKTMIDFLTK